MSVRPSPLRSPSALTRLITDLESRARNLDTLWPAGQTISRLHRNGAMYLIVLILFNRSDVSEHDLRILLDQNCDELRAWSLSHNLRLVTISGREILEVAGVKTPRTMEYLQEITPERQFNGTIPEVVEQLLALVHESRRPIEALEAAV